MAMATVSYPEQLRMADESAIGKYIQYEAGPLAGRCVRLFYLPVHLLSQTNFVNANHQLRVIRSELQAYQKPDLGRKYAVEALAPHSHALLC